MILTPFPVVWSAVLTSHPFYYTQPPWRTSTPTDGAARRP